MTALSISYDGKIPLAPTCFVRMTLALIAEACGTCMDRIIEWRTVIAAMSRSATLSTTEATSAMQKKRQISLLGESPWLEAQ